MGENAVVSLKSLELVDLGRALALLRQRRGLNQAELAHELGMSSTSSVGAWERGTASIGAGKLMSYLDAVGSDFEDLHYALAEVRGTGSSQLASLIHQVKRFAKA